MKRRTLLGGVSLTTVAFAGCLGSDDDAGDDDPDDTASDSDTDSSGETDAENGG